MFYIIEQEINNNRINYIGNNKLNSINVSTSKPFTIYDTLGTQLVDSLAR